jgi:hypothetical protein
MLRFFLCLPLFLITPGSAPETMLTDDHVYVTTGILELPVPLADAEEVLTDYANYRNWAFKGMSGDEPTDGWHIAWLQDCIYEPETETMNVIFGLHLLGALRSRNNSIRFRITESWLPGGKLERISFSLADRSLFMKRAEYGVELTGNEVSTDIHYFGYVRLAPIVDIFFNLKIYKSNIEWYMIRMIANLQVRLENYRS